MSANINISLPPKHKHDFDHQNSDWETNGAGSHRDLIDAIRECPHKINWSQDFVDEQGCYRRPESISEFKGYLITRLPHESERIELMCRVLESDNNYHIGTWG